MYVQLAITQLTLALNTLAGVGLTIYSAVVKCGKELPLEMKLAILFLPISLLGFCGAIAIIVGSKLALLLFGVALLHLGFTGSAFFLYPHSEPVDLALAHISNRQIRLRSKASRLRADWAREKEATRLRAEQEAHARMARDKAQRDAARKSAEQEAARLRGVQEARAKAKPVTRMRRTYSSENIAPMIPTLSDKRRMVRSLANELRNDIEKLAENGIVLDQTSQVAQVGGVVGAGASWYFGHPVVALVLGGIALLAGSFTEEQKRIELNKARLKWMRITSELGPELCELMVTEMQCRHSGFLGSARALLAPPG